MSQQGASAPLGCVLPYAGSLTGTELNTLGWAVCDGSQMQISSYSELFAVLGTCNGGDGNTYFNLPNYQGFFLRGFDPTKKVDPDANKRSSPASGGATGDNVGSIQYWATANAKNKFSASVPNVPNDDHNAYASSDCTMLISGSQTCNSSAGGDNETRPVNAYVRYIIKTTNSAGLITGSIIPFAGSSSSGSVGLQNFILCDGTLLPQSIYSDLYNAIKKAHGGNETAFNIPDYRGRFLRGMSGQTDIDPDKNSRTAMNSGGATGNNVGSIQGWATGKPNNSFTFSVGVGTNRADSSVCAGHDNSAWNDGSTTVTMTNSGGDNESRPVNASVDYYILKNKDQNTEDIFPIGGVIGIPSNAAPPSSQWLLCNGSTISNTDQFTNLFYAISNDNGGDSENFNIPNYQGQFLRGCDHGQRRDPDAKERTAAAVGGLSGDNVGSIQGWATGKPNKPITTQVNHCPTDDHHNAAALGGNDVANWGDTENITVSGGDSETRPTNAYIKFYIKYA